MDVVRIYKREIVENKNIVLVSIFLSILIRLFLFYFRVDLQPSFSEGSLLWRSIASEFLTNRFLSFFLTCVSCLAIMSYAAYLNSKHSLIRTRTYLVYVCVVLIFSCHPAFIYMNSGYITLFLFLVCVDALFNSYQEASPARKSYAIGFLLALSSLFSIYMLYYLILFWIGFKMMRSFSFKSFISSILGVITIYWLFFCYCLWKSDLSIFVDSFTQIKFDFVYFFPLATQLVFYSFGVILLLVVFFNYQISSFQDKIRTRAKIYFLSIIAIFSLFFSFFLNSNGINSFYIFELAYALLLAHFFSVSLHRWQVSLFYIFILFSIVSAFLL